MIFSLSTENQGGLSSWNRFQTITYCIYIDDTCGFSRLCPCVCVNKLLTRPCTFILGGGFSHVLLCKYIDLLLRLLFRLTWLKISCVSSSRTPTSCSWYLNEVFTWLIVCFDNNGTTTSLFRVVSVLYGSASTSVEM